MRKYRAVALFTAFSIMSVMMGMTAGCSLFKKNSKFSPDNIYKVCVELEAEEYDNPEDFADDLDDEFMLDEGYSQEEAVELMEYCKDHIGDSDRSDLRDMLELYDVPDEISSVILDIRRLPSRERMIAELIKLLSRAAVELEHRPELKETKDIY